MRHRASDRPTRPPIASAAALLGCLFALGCGSGDSPAPEPATAPTPEAAAAVPAPPAAPGETESIPEATATEGVIPEGYPSDVPVYPGSAPGPAMAMPGLGVFATSDSGDTADAILSHFRGELTKAGWAVEDAPAGGLDATKEGRSVQVRTRAKEAGGTEIAVNISEKG